MLLRAITDPKLATAPVLARLHAHQSVIEVHTDNDTKAAERSIAKAIKALDSTPAAGRDLGWMQARSTVRKAQLELADLRSEEHTSELQSLMRISYAVFCLKKNNKS